MSKSNKTAAATVVETAVKAPKVTLNSIVLAVAPVLPTLAEGAEHSPEVLAKYETDLTTFIDAQAVSLADYLVEKSDNVEIITRLFTATVALVPAVLEREAENIAKRKADREATRTAAKAQREADQKALAASLEEEKKTMLQTLLDNNLDLATAKAMVEAGMKSKIKAASAPVKSYDRVTVEYNGTKYEMPVKGNMGNELKAILTESKLDRDEFIKAYKVEAETDAETETAGE
jgi:hypothetical protein